MFVTIYPDFAKALAALRQKRLKKPGASFLRIQKIAYFVPTKSNKIMTYRLEEIASITGGTLTGRDCRIERVITDSRNPYDPAATLFVAIRGNHHDGHAFIRSLYAGGVRAFLTDSDIDRRDSFGAPIPSPHSNASPHTTATDSGVRSLPSPAATAKRLPKSGSHNSAHRV